MPPSTWGLLALVAGSALVAMVLLILSVGELDRILDPSRDMGLPDREVGYLHHLQVGILVAVAVGVAATLVAVRWLAAASRRLSAARDEIAEAKRQLSLDAVTERRLELQLVEAAGHWAATFDAIDAVIAVVDREGRLLRLNRYAADLLGGRPQDFVGLSILRWAQSEPWRRMTELLGKPVTRGPTEGRDEEEGRSWVVSASYDSELGGTVFLARDSTDLLELRAQLERRRRGDEMATFVAGVAHEVRNPLFAITANLQALQEEGDKAAVFDEYFGWIHAAATRLQVLMQDLLDYARPATADLAQGSLREVIDRSIASCAILARRSEVEVRFECPPDLPEVMMDPEQLEQVFGNLIQNAIAMSPPQGVLRIAAGREGAAGVVCTVEDSGPGFSPEEIERGFEPFFSRRKGGTGLGLAVVRRIMESHGGSVDLGNREAGGARVRLAFPLELAESFVSSGEG